ncbi:MAG TPA: amino acid ABC transporter ATP-binding protein [Terrimicrobiaceae bacterium]|nr:amino acid ABC transporter ATP-binding protein [Terrimicrobiaceae bacterium]
MKLHCDGVVKTFGRHRALDGASLDCEFAHTLALIGPSGGGKSTLLRVLGGLEYPDQGSVAVNGRLLSFEEASLAAYRRRIGTVFQAYNLFPHLSALDNILLPLEKVHRFPDSRERAAQVLERFRLAAHAGKKPAELSGGQRQRVAIARALAIQPEFLLMDEPTSALDPEMTAEVLEVIAGLREAGQPLVLVTHEMGFARETADFVAFVADGRVLECTAAAEFFDRPRTVTAQKFLERILKY